MNLTILGSAASEGWPALFCTCEPCREARRLGGKDIRRRTSYRLGEQIQIDWGPDTYAACVAHGLDMSTLTDLVITHAHGDHFTPGELWYRREGFSQVPEDHVLTVRGSRPVEIALRMTCPEDVEYRLAFQLLTPYQDAMLPGGVTLMPFPAAHAEGLDALNFILRVGGRLLLIANDTGWWAEEVWEFLGGYQFDVVVMDCTYGQRQARGGHLGAPDVVEARQELLARGSLQDQCRFIANHFSHNGGWLHAELEGFFAPHGIEVGFDGMVVEL